MNLKETLEMLNNVITDHTDLIKNEESTKQFLILPFFKGLGYDIHSPKEVTPEFTADFHKKNEKVDYAIYLNEEPRIFVEAKSMHNAIIKNAPQLSRYFSTFTTVKLGVLTNGIEYRFFTDLTNTNIMDTKPFFIFNITKYTEEDFEHLIKFSKNLYDEESIKALAESLVYFQSFKSVIKEIFETPSDDFIKFVIKERFKFKVTQQFITSSRPIIQKSMQQAITEVISEKFNIDIANPSLETTQAEPLAIASTPEKKVYYTKAELESLNKVEIFEDVTIVLPKADSYKKLLNLDETNYSVEKGNPSSDFFISSVVIQGSTTFGYIVGQYINEKDDIKLYCIKATEIAKFLTENPLVKEKGFMNFSRLKSRVSKRKTQSSVRFLFQRTRNLILHRHKPSFRRYFLI